MDGQFGRDQVSLLEADDVWKSPMAAAQGHTVMEYMQPKCDPPQEVKELM